MEKGKTPISYLQELCTKRNVTPQYDLIANEGAVHEPTFVFRVIAGEFFGTGKGPSKKKAKHSAALSILSQMLGLNQSSFESDECNGSSKDTDELAGNPVGDLQEFSQRKLWPPPEYVFTGEQGPPHAREFICMVQLANFQERGTGKSKKLAKRNAAVAMLQMMKQGVGAAPKVEVEPVVEADAVDDGLPLPQTSPTTSRADFDVFLHQQPVVLEATSVRATRYFDKARKSARPLPLAAVAGVNGDVREGAGDCCAMLQQLSVEQKFDVAFEDLDFPSLSGGGVQCLVQLSLKPAAVCHGKGATADDARRDAAENALSYLEVLHLRGKR